MLSKEQYDLMADTFARTINIMIDEATNFRDMIVFSEFEDKNENRYSEILKDYSELLKAHENLKKQHKDLTRMFSDLRNRLVAELMLIPKLEVGH